MGITLKLDSKIARAKITRMLGRADNAAADALRAGLAPVMAQIIAQMPRDTNRLVAGYAEAANEAGIGSFDVPAVKPGKFVELARVGRRLEEQLRYWSFIVQRYERAGRVKDKWYRRAVRTRDRAAEELAKFRANPSSIAIFGGRGRRLKVTVRPNAYGGAATWTTLPGGGVVVEIHNKEPHASIIESRTRIVRAALATGRAEGVKRLSRAYVRRLTAGETGAAA